ncbi:hypothetical protein FKM82_027227, partial [Ascaphus truei]
SVPPFCTVAVCYLVVTVAVSPWCHLVVTGPCRGLRMRYNEKELLSLSRQRAEKAAELSMRGPKKGSVLKKRLVKLVVNFLFYFRTDEEEVV